MSYSNYSRLRPRNGTCRLGHIGKAVNDIWFHSPGHHVNMLTADNVRIGVGRSGVYYTEQFGK